MIRKEMILKQYKIYNDSALHSMMQIKLFYWGLREMIIIRYKMIVSNLNW